MIERGKPTQSEQPKKPFLSIATALTLHKSLAGLPNTELAVKVLELTTRVMRRPTFPAEVNRATRQILTTQTVPEDQQKAEMLADCIAIICNHELYYPILRRDNEAVAQEKTRIMGSIRTLRGLSTQELTEIIVLSIAEHDMQSGALQEGSEKPSLLEQLLWTDNPTQSDGVNKALSLTRQTFTKLIAEAQDSTDDPSVQTV